MINDYLSKLIIIIIGIKQLLMVLEMARSDVDTDDNSSESEKAAGNISPEQFLECLHTAGF
jgi:hypothetical protein